MLGLFLLTMSAGAHVQGATESAVAAGIGVGAVSAAITTSTLITEDRFSQTLAHIILAPVSVIGGWIGRVLVLAAAGMASATAGLAATLTVTGVDGGLALVGWSMLAMFSGVVGASCLGMTLGALSLRTRDALLPANLAQHFLTLTCGAVAPIGVLPEPLRSITQILPLTQAIAAGRAAARGAAGELIVAHVCAAFALGCAWLGLGLWLWRLVERSARRKNTIDLTAI